MAAIPDEENEVAVTDKLAVVDEVDDVVIGVVADPVAFEVADVVADLVASSGVYRGVTLLCASSALCPAE